MKKVIFIIALFCATIIAGAQIHVNTYENVGIGTTSPAQKLDVNGNLVVRGSISSNYSDGNLGSYYDRWYQLYAEYPVFSYNPIIDSDIRLKKDVKSLDPVLEKIKLLQAVTYKMTGKNKEKVVFGLIAQDVQSLFPEIVEKTQDELLGIRYGDLVPVLLQAIQEQQKQIETLQKQLNDLSAKIDK